MPTYSFGSFELDARERRLTRNGSAVALSDRPLRVLQQLVAQAGTVLSKDALVAAAWEDVAVTDNSLEQAISSIRRALGIDEGGATLIETIPRQGYRFTGTVARIATRESDATLEALLAPHRAWIEGRAALETLKRENIVLARQAFERALAQLPDSAPAHVGLANAAVMEFEATRSGPRGDVTNLRTAIHHAQEACRLDPSMGEGWATLGFVLARIDRQDDALAAARRAVALEPDNWRHQLRLSSIAWGEERLRAAKRTLALVNGLPLAHYLAATVHVARQACDIAERELRTGIAGEESMGPENQRFGGVALHWLLGLILLSQGDEPAALEELQREVALESRGHLYAREVCAHAQYAIGAVKLRQGRGEEARLAFEQCVERSPTHAMARLGLALLDGSVMSSPPAVDMTVVPVERAMVRAAVDAVRGRRVEAARVVDEALRDAAPGSAFWLLPLEPLLSPWTDPTVWAGPLARLRARAV